MNDPLRSALVSARVTHRPAEGTVFHARSHSLALGVPMSFDKAEPRLSAVELFMAAVCSDVLGGLTRVAKKRRICLDALEATVDAQLADALAYLGVVGETGQPRIASLQLKAWVDSPAPYECLNSAWEETLRLAPLVQTLQSSSMQISLSWQLI